MSPPDGLDQLSPSPAERPRPIAPVPPRFLPVMIQDIRTPLNTVIGYSDALLAHPATAEGQIADYARAINAAGRQLQSLADTILDMARLEAELALLPVGPVDIGRLVSHGTAQLAAQAQSGQLVLMSDVSPALPLLRGDERRLAELFRHLITNAVNFTPPGGAVRVAVRRGCHRGDLLVLVSDTGSGIPPGELSRVFWPFTQLAAAPGRGFSGGGLGLYVSQMIARAHGGDLVLRSDVGIGTTAVLRLPASRLVEPSAPKEIV